MGYTYFGVKNHDKRERQKPTRKDLGGMSPSEFKTFLKQLNFLVYKQFFKFGSIAIKGSRRYRFRWWNDGFVVDVSEPKSTFDRWANSVETILTFQEFKDRYVK